MIFLEVAFGVGAGLYLHDNLRWFEEKMFNKWKARKDRKVLAQLKKKEKEAMESLARMQIESPEGMLQERPEAEPPSLPELAMAAPTTGTIQFTAETSGTDAPSEWRIGTPAVQVQPNHGPWDDTAQYSRVMPWRRV